MRETTIAVIPARMASSRYPGKPLAKILSLTMIEHVRRRALLTKGIDKVVVATCDQTIMDAVTEAGGNAVMTSDKHERSTERVAEAMHSLQGDVVVIVQGDEPLLIPETLQKVVESFRDHRDLNCVSLLSVLESKADYNNPNIVKAACDQNGYVLFFSRAPVPFFVNSGRCPVYRETGIRAFRREFLQTYVDLPETPFERVETVDMLRLLEHGHRILGVVTDYVTFGVDLAEDVTKVEHILRTDSFQKSLYEKILKENL